MSRLRLCSGGNGRIVVDTAGEASGSLDRLENRFYEGVLLELRPEEGVVRSFLKVRRNAEEQWMGEFESSGSPATLLEEYVRAVDDVVAENGWSLPSTGENQEVFEALETPGSTPLDRADATRVREQLDRYGNVDLRAPNGSAAVGLLSYLLDADIAADSYAICNGRRSEPIADVDVVIGIDRSLRGVDLGVRTKKRIHEDAIVNAKAAVSDALGSLSTETRSSSTLSRLLNGAGLGERLDVVIQETDATPKRQAFKAYALPILGFAVLIGLPIALYVARGSIAAAMAEPVPVLLPEIAGRLGWSWETNAGVIAAVSLFVTAACALGSTRVRRTLASVFRPVTSRVNLVPAGLLAGAAASGKAEPVVDRLETLRGRTNDEKRFLREANDLLEGYGLRAERESDVKRDRLLGGAVGAVFALATAAAFVVATWQSFELVSGILTTEGRLVAFLYGLLFLAGISVSFQIARAVLFLFGRLGSGESRTAVRGTATTNRSRAFGRYKNDRKDLEANLKAEDWSDIEERRERYVQWLKPENAKEAVRDARKKGRGKSIDEIREPLARSLKKAHKRGGVLTEHQIRQVEQALGSRATERDSGRDGSDRTGGRRGEATRERSDGSITDSNRPWETFDKSVSERTQSDGNSRSTVGQGVTSPLNRGPPSASRESRDDRSEGGEFSGKTGTGGDNAEKIGEGADDGSGGRRTAVESTVSDDSTRAGNAESVTRSDVYPMARANASNSGSSSVTFDSPGEVVWEYEIESQLSAPPVTDGETVYLGGRNKTFVALDLDRGAERWRRAMSSRVSATPAVGGFVFAPTRAGRLYALDTDSGEVEWHVRLDGTCRCPPTLAAGAVYVGTDAGGIYGYPIDDHENPVFEEDDPSATAWRRYSVDTPPIVHEDLVAFVGSSDDDAVVMLRGQKSNHIGIEDAVSVPAVTNGKRLYAVADTGSVYEIGGKNRREIYGTEAPKAAPVIDDGRLYVPTSSGIATVTVDEASAWNAALDSPPSCAPTLAGDTLLVPTVEGTLEAFDASDGTRRWKLNVGGRVVGEPIVVDDTLVAATRGGRVIARR